MLETSISMLANTDTVATETVQQFYRAVAEITEDPDQLTPAAQAQVREFSPLSLTLKRQRVSRCLLFGVSLWRLPFRVSLFFVSIGISLWCLLVSWCLSLWCLLVSPFGVYLDVSLALPVCSLKCLERGRETELEGVNRECV